MFSGISSRYDVMNHLMTAGPRPSLAAHRGRAGRARSGCASPRRLLRDRRFTLALAAMFPSSEVTGLDFTEAMLARARTKAARREARGPPAPRFVRGDLLALPFADDKFAAITVGWGVRNVPDVRRAFEEMKRVTRPGCRVVCLESTQPPPGLGGCFHLVWMGGGVPLLGQLSRRLGCLCISPGLRGGLPAADELAAIMRRRRAHAGALPALRLRRGGDARR